MGSARVQYALERTLPQLTWLESTGQFSKSELQHITSIRSKHEQSLVRRGVTRVDYLRYLSFEKDVEALRQLREDRLEHALSVKESAKARANGLRNLINIYERGCRRLRGDVEFWEEYIAWSLHNGMRIVSGRIISRALALFPNVIRLWIKCADWQLNKNGAPNAARALLQRGIRLNARPHLRRAQEAVDRPSKRQRTLPANTESQSHLVRAKISREERDVLSLWLEYVRMELVFLERIRRRRKVLGLSMDEENASDQAATLQDEAAETEAERQLLKDVPQGDVASEANGEAAPAALQVNVGDTSTSRSATIVQGAIPISVMHAAMDLSSATSLPPRTHLHFLLSLGLLFRAFPFLDGEASNGPRAHLIEALRIATETRLGSSEVFALIQGSSSLLDKAFVLQVPEDEEVVSEGDSQTSLSKASQLAASGSSAELLLLHNLSQDPSLDALPKEQEAYEAPSVVLRLACHAFGLARAEPDESTALLLRGVVESFRNVSSSEMVKQFDSPTRTRLVRCIIAFYFELGRFGPDHEDVLDPELKSYLRAATLRVIKGAEKTLPLTETVRANLELQLDAILSGLKQGTEQSQAWQALYNSALQATQSTAQCSALSAQDLLAILRIRLRAVRALHHPVGSQLDRQEVQQEWRRLCKCGGERLWSDVQLVQERCAWLQSDAQSDVKGRKEKASLLDAFQEDLRAASRQPDAFLQLARAYLSSGAELQLELSEQTNRILRYAPSDTPLLCELFLGALQRHGILLSDPSAPTVFSALPTSSKNMLNELSERLKVCLNKPAQGRAKVFWLVGRWERDVNRDVGAANELMRRAFRVLGSRSRQWLEQQWVAQTASGPAAEQTSGGEQTESSEEEEESEGGRGVLEQEGMLSELEDGSEEEQED